MYEGERSQRAEVEREVLGMRVGLDVVNVVYICVVLQSGNVFTNIILVCLTGSDVCWYSFSYPMYVLPL